MHGKTIFTPLSQLNGQLYHCLMHLATFEEDSHYSASNESYSNLSEVRRVNPSRKKIRLATLRAIIASIPTSQLISVGRFERS